MKKKYLIFSTVMGVLFALFVLLNLFVANGEYSSLENRYLQGLPSFSLGSVADRSFMEEAEAWGNDQLAFRDFFIKTKAAVERLLGKKENNGVYYAKDDYLIEKPAEADEALIKSNIESVKTFSENNRFSVSLCIIPQSYEVLKDKLPRGAYQNVIPAFYQTLSEGLSGANLHIVNPTEVLSQHKDEYIYYRTDHHLTTEGTYLIYQSLGEVCGYTPLSKESFGQAVVSEEFFGTTYSKGLGGTKADSILVYQTELNQKATVSFYGEDKKADSLFFQEHLDKKDKYSYFLDGNHGVTVLSGGVPGGGSIALFKDSYAHSLAPFLINHFESVHLIDMRYFSGDPMQYLADNDIRKVLFLYGTSTFMADSSIQKIGEYAKTSPFATFGLVKEGEPVSNSYFADAVFLGDSLSLGFEAYSGVDEATYLCRTSLSLWGVFNKEEDGTSLLEKVQAAKPKKIYLMLGMNEELVMSNKDAIMEKFVSVTEALKRDNPGALIYIQSIFPVSREEADRGRIENELIHSLNESLRVLAEEKYMHFIDVYKAVTDEEGYLFSHLTSDGIHMGPEGCKLWADYLKAHAIRMGDEERVVYDKAAEGQEGQYDLDKILEDVKGIVTFEGDVGETSQGVLLKTHGIKEEQVAYAKGIVGGGATAEEIALFEAKDADGAKAIKSLLETYVEQRIKSFESYIPKEVPKLRSKVLYVKDNFVALVIAKDAGAARKVLEKIK